MMEASNNISLVSALISSIPPTLTALTGFFIFHNLALRRQKREEVRQLCSELKDLISEIAEIGIVAWDKPGQTAVLNGDVAKYKSRVFLADNKLLTIECYKTEIHSILKEPYREFKKIIDEFENGGKTRVSIEGDKRPPEPDASKHIIRTATGLIKNIDTAFIAEFK